MTTQQLRKELILYAHRLDAKGFVANHDGNLSARLHPENGGSAESERFLATPTARGKFDLRETDLIVVDHGGKTRAGSGKVFGEWVLHAELYKSRPDMLAVVHAHPPHAASLGLAGRELPVDFWPEGVVSLGRRVPCVELDDMAGLGRAALRASACLMQGNGVFAWGGTPEQAYLRLELVEHLSRIFALAQSAGTLRSLPQETVSQLLEKRKRAGLLSPEELNHA